MTLKIPSTGLRDAALGAAVQVENPPLPPFAKGGDSAAMIESVSGTGEPSGTVWRVWAIRAGMSKNNVDYPVPVLREAAPLFEGARVFEKSDEEHLKGQGKATRNLIGQLRNAQFIEAEGAEAAGIQAELHLLEASGLPAKFLEMQGRDMLGLVGFSIDAQGAAKPRGPFREAVSITHVKSLDLIVDPGAGGRIINLIESEGAADMALRERMIEAVSSKHGGELPAGLDVADDAALEAAYREAVAERPPVLNGDIAAVQARLDRLDMREAVDGSGLPDKIKARLHGKIDNGTTKAALDALIADFREGLGELAADGRVSGLGGPRVEMGADRADKVRAMLDDFFDRSKRAVSFRECYVEMTGDTGVTGLMQHCDAARLREAAGGASFREAISSGTFAHILGDSITRAMVRDYNALENYNDWRALVDIVPVSNFRTQERTRMGGYGNLPGVAENAAYTALTSPDDEKATYAITKRGGRETISMETIANDDVGAIRKVPQRLAVAAKRTLYEFVLDFLRLNPAIYDGVALFHAASHGNLGTAALAAASFAAARLAVKQQQERDSDKPLGLILKHLYVPAQLEEAAFNLFVRGTNLDETFVQSRKPTVHVVDYWADANNWYATADVMETPLIEMGFYNGSEEPELYVQDLPTQGSLFSNDQIVYKIRHIYGGAVLDYRGFYGAVVP